MLKKIHIIEVVKCKKSEQKFLHGTEHIYKNDKNWIPNLDKDIRNIFDKNKNQLLKNGRAKRWIVSNKKGKTLGRIAAFFNTRKALNHDQPTGGIGFYECIDCKEISSILFNTAISWLKSNNMEAVDGPINFGENYNYWGLLIKGHIPQMYGMQYHPKYYKKHFEDFGFKLFYKQYSFRMKPNDFPERLFKIGEWVDQKERFTARHLDFSDIDSFSRDMTKAFNVIWSSYKKDYTPLENSDIKEMFEDSKLIIDPKLVWIIYHNQEPVSFAIMIPNVNKLIKHIDGKLNLINIIKLLYYKKIGKINSIRSLVIGVAPKYQKFGVEAFLFYKVRQVFDKTKYKELEFSWIGDFNLKMLSLINAIGPKKTSTHATYRFLFDRNKEFIRYPLENYLNIKE